MAIKQKDGSWKCLFCNYTSKNPFDVDDHVHASHDYVLLPLLREEIVRLMQFIMTKDEQLITEDLYKKIRAYSQFKIIPKE